VRFSAHWANGAALEAAHARRLQKQRIGRLKQAF
jgi:hypothetical protein